MEIRSFRNVIGDTIYAYFDPIRSAFRYIFRLKHYRVTYHVYGGPRIQEVTEEFTAEHDRQARRMAQSIAVTDDFELESFRSIKVSRKGDG